VLRCCSTPNYFPRKKLFKKTYFKKKIRNEIREIHIGAGSMRAGGQLLPLEFFSLPWTIFAPLALGSND